MFGTELIDFVVNLVCDPGFFIVLSVVQNRIINHLFSELIDNFDFIKINKCPIRSTTWDIYYCVSLNTNFHLYELLDEWNPEMEPRLC